MFVVADMPEGTHQGHFNVQMDKPCFVCGNPTRVILRTRDALLFLIGVLSNEPLDVFTRAFLTWNYMWTLDLEMNKRMYKKFGSVVRPVCWSCYCTPIRCNHVGRETGRVPFRHRTHSWSTEDIYDWFNRFNSFMNRRDLDSFLI